MGGTSGPRHGTELGAFQPGGRACTGWGECTSPACPGPKLSVRGWPDTSTRAPVCPRWGCEEGQGEPGTRSWWATQLTRVGTLAISAPEEALLPHTRTSAQPASSLCAAPCPLVRDVQERGTWGWGLCFCISSAPADPGALVAAESHRAATDVDPPCRWICGLRSGRRGLGREAPAAVCDSSPSAPAAVGVGLRGPPVHMLGSTQPCTGSCPWALGVGSGCGPCAQ